MYEFYTSLLPSVPSENVCIAPCNQLCQINKSRGKYCPKSPVSSRAQSEKNVQEICTLQDLLEPSLITQLHKLDLITYISIVWLDLNSESRPDCCSNSTKPSKCSKLTFPKTHSETFHRISMLLTPVKRAHIPQLRTWRWKYIISKTGNKFTLPCCRCC